MVSADGPGEAREFDRASGAVAEPNRVRNRADQRQQDRDAGQYCRSNQQPARITSRGPAKAQGRQQDHHDQRDEMTHRTRRRRCALVVPRDGVEHRLGQHIGTAMPKDLSIEDQVHPQHGYQKAGAGGRDQTVAASLSSLRVLVASRYSWTQRSITAEVFSTLVN